MKTRLTERLGIDHPIVQAGMGGVAHAPLVAAVSGAGALGQLAAFAMSPDDVAQQVAAIRSITANPFAVNVIAAGPGAEILRLHGKAGQGDGEDSLRQIVETAIDGGARLVVSALGVPAEVVDMCHRRDVLVGNMCGKVLHAQRAVAAGCDVIIAQGTEAGGHTGAIATMPLVPQVVDAVGDEALVLAAGGIFDGRGLAAALALGADGVVVGTRFAATPEARATRGYKEAVLANREDATVISRAYSGKTMRVIRNEYTAYFEEHPEELLRFPHQMEQTLKRGYMNLGLDVDVEVDAARESYPAGQAIGAIDELLPAAEIVRRMVSEAEHALGRLGVGV